MAALTPTAIQLFATWGCIPAARSDFEGVFGAIGGKSINMVETKPKADLLPFFFTAHLWAGPQGLVMLPLESTQFDNIELNRSRSQAGGKMAMTRAWDREDSEGPCALAPPRV